MCCLLPSPTHRGSRCRTGGGKGKRPAEEAGCTGGAEEGGADIIFDGLPPNFLGAPEGGSRHHRMRVSQALHLCVCVLARVITMSSVCGS